MKQNKHRFSLFAKVPSQEILIMIDEGIIYECLFKDKKTGRWEHGMGLGMGQKFAEVAPFNEWRNATAFSIEDDATGYKKDFSKQEVSEMKRAIMKVDKRVRLQINT